MRIISAPACANVDWAERRVLGSEMRSCEDQRGVLLSNVQEKGDWVRVVPRPPSRRRTDVGIMVPCVVLRLYLLNGC